MVPWLTHRLHDAEIPAFNRTGRPTGFGVFHEFPSPDDRPDSEAFAEALDVVDGAERWGLDVM